MSDEMNPSDPALKQPRMVSAAYALCFATILPKLQGVARTNGYALAVHGSMMTDLDLLAVPWVDTAEPAEVLVEAIRSVVNGVIRDESEHDHNPAWKPHGRLAWSIYLQPGSGPYIDLSVMPRRLGCYGPTDAQGNQT